MTQTIDSPTLTIAAAYARWKKNRDILSGEDAVKKARTEYLPALPTHDLQNDPKSYSDYLYRTPFFPGAARTLDGLRGLVTRKRGVLTAPDSLKDIFETITHLGHNVEDLAEEVFDETCTTNFTGMLIDMPSSDRKFVSVKDAERSNNRPFISLYIAESILEVTTGVRLNKKKIVRVRLKEDESTIRELILDDDGIYRQIVHVSVNGNWSVREIITPLINAKPIDEIPFIVVTSKFRSTDPVKGPLDDVVNINRHLYLDEASAANSRLMLSSPFVVMVNVDAPEKPLALSPGQILYLKSVNELPADVKIVEHTGAGQASLDLAVSTKKDEMSKLGLSILASEKAASEAAETHAIRRASENSILAALARTISRKIEEALRWVALWQGVDPEAVTYAMNTDFTPSSMSAQERDAALKELMAGAISWETYIGLLQDGEILSEGFDIDQERDRLQAADMNADRPTTEPVPAE